MLDDVHDVGSVRAELLGRSADAGRAGNQRVYLATARRVGERARRGHRFERELAQRGAARLRVYQDVRHQRTFASDWRSRTSSGTADAPSPMMRPAGRSGGSSAFCTETRTAPNWAGFDSSGFFFAAMIPLSDG